MSAKSIRQLILLGAFAVAGANIATAENTPEEDRQQLEQMMEMMKNSGIDPAQFEQVEAMMRGGAETGIRQKEQKIEAEKDEFFEAFGKDATAIVEVNGHRHALTITKCEWIDQVSGSFIITAEQAPGEDGATLMVDGGGSHSTSRLYFKTPSGSNEPQQRNLTFDGDKFEWSGVVAGFDGPELFVDINVRCE